MADGRVIIDALLNKEGAEKGIAELQTSLEKSAGKMKNSGKTLTKGVTLPIVGAGVAAGKFAIEQETAFAKVSTLLEGSTGDFEAYRDNIRQYSSDLGVSFGEYSEAVYQSISAGVDQGEAVKFSGEMAKLAKGGFTDMSTATDVVTTALNAYGMEAGDASKVSDMLINSQNLGKTTVNELASSMGAVIPIAQANGVSLEQLSSGYATLTKNGIATSEAGTYMKAMFNELGKSGSKADKILREKTGKSFAMLQEEGMNTADALAILQEGADESGVALGDMFGSTEAGAAALTLMKDGGDDFNKTLGSMSDSAGATEEAFEKMNNTTGQKMKKAWTEIQNSMAKIGENLLPIVEKLANAVGWLADKFSGISPTMQIVMIAVGALLAAIGPLLWVIGTIAGAVANLLPVFLFLGKIFAGVALGPVALIVGAVIGLIAIFVYLWKTNETFRDKVVEIWRMIQEYFMIALNYIKEIVNKVITDVVAFFKHNLEKIKEFWATHGDSIMAIVTMFMKNIWANIKMVMGIIKGIFQVVWPLITSIIKIAWEAIKLIVQTAIDLVMGIISTVMSLITGDWEGAWESIEGIAEDIWENIEKFFGNIDLLQMGKDIIQGLIDGISSMIGAVGDAVSNVAGNIKGGIKDFFRISSPAKVTIDQGSDIGEGLEVGLDKSIRGLEKKSIELAHSAMPNMNTPTISMMNQQATQQPRENLNISELVNKVVDKIVLETSFEVDGNQIVQATGKPMVRFLGEYSEKKSRGVGGVYIG